MTLADCDRCGDTPRTQGDTLCAECRREVDHLFKDLDQADEAIVPRIIERIVRRRVRPS